MVHLRKYYIRKKEQESNIQNEKFPCLIFNNDAPASQALKTARTLKTNQKFPNHLGSKLNSGGVTLQNKLAVSKNLGAYLQEIPLNLIAIQIQNKWYTGYLISKSRFDRPMEQLFYLLMTRQESLKKKAS